GPASRSRMMNVSLPWCKGNTFKRHLFRCGKIFWLGYGAIHGKSHLRPHSSKFLSASTKIKEPS
ncbi:MAG: hypothetical protein IKO85_09830, partial [Bacteroidaceae bacterium]|nr:hypothetical protein [Bacteroidaceae bacterium]